MVFFTVFPPPKNIRLLATAKKQLTVLWDHPDGIKGAVIKYKVILWDQFGRKCSIIEVIIVRVTMYSMCMFQAEI